MAAFLTALGDIGEDVVGYLGTAAIAALAVFAVIYGVRMVMRIFKGASK